jgi:hypothetical protein
VAARTAYSAVQDSAVNNATTAFEDAGTASVTIASADAASSDWLILATGVHQIDIADSIDSRVRLHHDTAAVVLDDNNVEMSLTDGTEWYPFFFMGKATFGAAPGDQEFSVEHAIEATGTNRDSWVRQVSLVAIKMTANDQFNSSDTPGAVSTGTQVFSDYLTLAWTPGTSGDYLGLGSAQHKTSTTTAEHLIRALMEDGSTERNRQVSGYKDNATQRQWCSAFRRTGLAASSQSWKIQHARNASTSTSTVDQGRLAALRISDFDGSDFAEDYGSPSADTTTSATFVDFHTLTKTLDDGVDYLFIAGWGAMDIDTANTTYGIRVWDGTTTFHEASVRGDQNNHSHTGVVVRVITGTGASVPFAIQAKSNGTATVSSNTEFIALLRLDAAGGVVDRHVDRAVVRRQALARAAVH